MPDTSTHRRLNHANEDVYADHGVSTLVLMTEHTLIYPG